MALRTTRRRAVAVTVTAVLAGAAALVASSAGVAVGRTCHGLPATVTASRGLVVGTSGPDVIALSGRATVHARAGRDVICGSRGNDTILAGPGDDAVLGRSGHDTIDGGPGADRVYGEQGRDHLIGGPGADTLMGGTDADRVERGSLRGANEAQAGDTVVPGDMAISLVIDPASQASMTASLQGFGTSWVPPEGGVAVSGGGIIAPPLTNIIAFQRAYSVWAVPFVPGGAFEPGAQLYNRWSPPASVSVPGQLLMTTAPGSDVAQLTPFVAFAGMQGIWVHNESLDMGVGGLLISTSANNSPFIGVPANQVFMRPLAYNEVPIPTSLVLYAGNWGAVWTGNVLGPISGPNTIVRFGGTSEVVDVSYDVRTGFSQG